jgi:hypothetical protein
MLDLKAVQAAESVVAAYVNQLKIVEEQEE